MSRRTDRPRGHQRDLQPGRADVRRRQQRLGGRQRRRVPGHRRPALGRGRSTTVIAGRRVLAIVCTHAHDDHVRVAPELAEAVDAPILLHPDDAPVWELTHPDIEPDGPLTDGKRIVVGDTRARGAAHAGPRARRGLPVLRPTSAWSSPATRCSTAARARPAGASPTTTRSSASIRTKLFALPDETVVHTGHGDSTTIGAEAAALGATLRRQPAAEGSSGEDSAHGTGPLTGVTVVELAGHRPGAVRRDDAGRARGRRRQDRPARRRSAFARPLAVRPDQPRSAERLRRPQAASRGRRRTTAGRLRPTSSSRACARASPSGSASVPTSCCARSRGWSTAG